VFSLTVSSTGGVFGTFIFCHAIDVHSADLACSRFRVSNVSLLVFFLPDNICKHLIADLNFVQKTRLTISKLFQFVHNKRG
jgi:hypothetical protein